MQRSNPEVTLPSELIKRCRDFGQRVVDDYANGWNANSRAVTCFDAHADAELQALAKMSECAFAIWARLDIDEAVHWGRFSDDGADLFWRGKRWDVKATKRRNQFLIWPIAKNGIFAAKKFDCLTLVKHDVPQFELAGWISKGEFTTIHETADESHKLFPGTWFVPEEKLWSMSLFDDYDATDDSKKSYYEGLRAIRERKANGGPGWNPK